MRTSAELGAFPRGSALCLECTLLSNEKHLCCRWGNGIDPLTVLGPGCHSLSMGGLNWSFCYYRCNTFHGKKKKTPQRKGRLILPISIFLSSFAVITTGQVVDLLSSHVDGDWGIYLYFLSLFILFYYFKSTYDSRASPPSFYFSLVRQDSSCGISGFPCVLTAKKKKTTDKLSYSQGYIHRGAPYKGIWSYLGNLIRNDVACKARSRGDQ